MAGRLKMVVLPDGRTVFTPEDVSDDEVYRGLGVRTEQPQERVSTGAAIGRGAVRGAAPAAGGLAGAMAGAELGGALGSAVGGWGAVPGAIIGGFAGGYYGGGKVAELQQQFFKDHPTIANMLGQSPEQQQTDTAQHPYASAIGEFAPNLLAMRPSISTFRNAGRAGLAARDAALASGATDEAALATGRAARGRIIGQRVNAVAGGGVGAGMDLANQYAIHPDDIDYGEVALQAGLGTLGQKEWGVGAKVGALRDRVLNRAELDTGQRLTNGQKADLLARGGSLDVNDISNLPDEVPDSYYGARQSDGLRAPVLHGDFDGGLVNTAVAGDATPRYGLGAADLANARSPYDASGTPQVDRIAAQLRRSAEQMGPQAGVGVTPEGNLTVPRQEAPMDFRGSSLPQGSPLNVQRVEPTAPPAPPATNLGVEPGAGSMGGARFEPAPVQPPAPKPISFEPKEALGTTVDQVRHQVVGDNKLMLADPTVRRFNISTAEAIRSGDKDALRNAFDDLEQAHQASKFSGDKWEQLGNVVENARQLKDEYVGAHGDEHVNAANEVRSGILDKTLADGAGQKPKEIERLYQTNLGEAGLTRRVSEAERQRIVEATKPKKVTKESATPAVQEKAPTPAQNGVVVPPKAETAAPMEKAPTLEAAAPAGTPAKVVEPPAPEPAPTGKKTQYSVTYSEEEASKPGNIGVLVRKKEPGASQWTEVGKTEFEKGDHSSNYVRVAKTQARKILTDAGEPYLEHNLSINNQPSTPEALLPKNALNKATAETKTPTPEAPKPRVKPPVQAEETIHDLLTPKEAATLARHYGEPEYNDVAKAKFEADVRRFQNDDAVPDKIHEIVKSVSDDFGPLPEPPKPPKGGGKKPKGDQIKENVAAKNAETRSRTKKETRSAAEEGKQPKGDQRERQGAREERQAPEAGRGNSAERGAAEQPKEEVAPGKKQSPVERVAERYAVEDGKFANPAAEENYQALLKDEPDLTREQLKERATAGMRFASDYLSGPKASKAANELSDPEAVKEQVELAQKTGSTHALLEALEKRGGMVGEAAGLLRQIAPDVKVKLVSENQLRLMMRKPGEPLPDTVFDGVYMPAEDTIYLSKNMQDASVVVHEAPHALTAWHITNKTEIGQRFTELYNEYKALAGESDSYGFDSADEFVSEIWRSETFRQELRDLMPKEEPAPAATPEAEAAPAPKSLFQRFKDAVSAMFAKMFKDRQAEEPAAIKEPEQQAQQLTDHIFEVMDLTRQAAENRFVKGGETPETTAMVRKNTEDLPEPLREASIRNANVLVRKAERVANTAAHTYVLVDQADRLGMPSAREWQNGWRSRNAEAAQTTADLGKWTEKFDALPEHLRGVGTGTLNGVAQDMRFSGMWAFKPEHLRDIEGRPIKVKTASEMVADGYVPKNANEKADLEIGLRAEREFKALPKQARDVIKEAYRVGHESFHKVWNSRIDFTNGQFDAKLRDNEEALNAAKAAGDTDRVKTLTDKAVQLEKNRKSALASYKAIMRADLSSPYLPVRRYGDFVVVGRSKAYIAEEKRAKDTGDQSRLREMEHPSQKHFFTAFVDSEFKAAKMRDEIAKEYGTADYFTRGQGTHELLGGRDTMYAMQKVKALLDGQNMDSESRESLQGMVGDMMMTMLAQNSARQAEARFRKIDGGNFDMFRGFKDQVQADAHMIGALFKNDQILSSLMKLKEEAKEPVGGSPSDRTQREALLQEINARHAMSMAPPPVDKVINFATQATSYWMLMRPRFLLQQIMQNPVITWAKLAARHGHLDSGAALTNGLKKALAASDGTGMTGALDISKLSPEDRAYAQFWQSRGLLDIGVNKTLRQWNSSVAGDKAHVGRKLVQVVNNLSRKAEEYNRFTAAYAAAELALKSKDIPRLFREGEYATYLQDFKRTNRDTEVKPLSPKQYAAAVYAENIVNTTHGAYDAFNAPRIMRTGLGKAALQFRNFQLMQIEEYARAIKDGWRSPDLTPQEQAVARRTFAYMVGHTAVIGGALAMPGVAKLIDAYNWLTSDDEHRGDMERDIREALGPGETTELLLHGLPALGGLNLTDTLGQSTILSVQPYNDLPHDAKSWATFVTGLAGPAIGGWGTNMFRGVDQIGKGYTYKGLELMMPGVISDGMKAYRLANEGETDNNGDVTEKSISPLETGATALGLKSLDTTERQFNRNQSYENAQFLKDKEATLHRRFNEARAAGDAATMQSIRDQWVRLQSSAKEMGIRPKPLGSLMKSYRAKEKRERDTRGGVQFTNATRREVENLTNLTGYGDDEE